VTGTAPVGVSAAVVASLVASEVGEVAAMGDSVTDGSVACVSVAMGSAGAVVAGISVVAGAHAARIKANTGRIPSNFMYFISFAPFKQTTTIIKVSYLCFNGDFS
jgi:hypothetical protein